MAQGLVTTLHPADLEYVRAAFKSQLQPLEAACLRPELSALEDFARHMKGVFYDKYQDDVPLSEVLDVYEELHEADAATFFLGDSMADLQANAEALQDIKIPLTELFVFCMAPVDLESSQQRASYMSMALDFAAERKVPLLRNVRIERRVPTTPAKLKDVESAHQCLELYAWLALRFTSNFPGAAARVLRDSSAAERRLRRRMSRRPDTSLVH